MEKAPILTASEINRMVMNKEGFNNCLQCEHGVAEAQKRQVEEGREWLLHLLTESLRAAEMRQGCTNHSYYAEIIVDQILSKLAILDKAQEKDTLKKICDLLWDLLEASKSPSPFAIPIKLQTILESLKRGEVRK